MVSLSEDMLLYHGSYAGVCDIDLSKCADGKDFGKGFYLTSDFDRARRLIASSVRKAVALGVIPKDCDYGFVSSFKLAPGFTALPTFEFDGTTREWLWFVSANRRAAIAGKLIDRLPDDARNAEIVIGKVANDTTNPVITTYLNGLYGPLESEEAVDAAVRLLLPDKLKDQYCFLTQRAVDLLIPAGVERYGI